MFPAADQRCSSGALVIRYLVKYSKFDDKTKKHSDFLTNEHLAHFVWNKATNTFGFEASRSSISEAEISAISNIEDEEEDTSGTTVGNTTFYSRNETKAFVAVDMKCF